ncbi:hypothetical protein Tco_0809322 [Tanacetum coccineum]
MTLDTHNWSSIAHQEIHKILKRKIFDHQPSGFRTSIFEIQFLKEAAKFVRDCVYLLQKIADESLAKHKALELEIESLLRAVVSQDIMSIVQNPSVIESSNLQTKLDLLKNANMTKLHRLKLIKTCKKDRTVASSVGRSKMGKSKDTSCVSNTLDPLSQKLENENVELEFQVRNYEKEIAHLKTTYKNLFDSISVTRAQTKTIIDSLQNKLHDTIYENAKLRAQLFDKVSEQEDTTKGTSTNTKFANQSTERKPSLQPVRKNLVVRQPNAFQSERTTSSKNWVPQKVDETNDLSKPVTSNSVPTPQESKIVKHDNVIAPRMETDIQKKPKTTKQARDGMTKSIRSKSVKVKSQPHEEIQLNGLKNAITSVVLQKKKTRVEIANRAKFVIRDEGPKLPTYPNSILPAQNKTQVQSRDVVPYLLPAKHSTP